jgi:hypothetical protein
MTIYRATQSLFVALFLVAAAVASPASAYEDGLKRFFGAYVGAGIAEQVDKGTQQQRTLDVTIEPYKDNGFTLKWITVMFSPDEANATSSVKRREISESFVPLPDKNGIFIDAPTGGLFSKAELPNPLKGEPMRWAALDGDSLTVYSMAITDTGASEMQVYHRTLTATGLTVRFMRMHDENVMVRLTGDLVKAQ